jgi:hypothetical protein
MKKIFEKMAAYIEANSPNERHAGRKSSYSIPDMLNRGEHLVYNIAGKATVPEDDAQ